MNKQWAVLSSRYKQGIRHSERVNGNSKFCQVSDPKGVDARDTGGGMPNINLQDHKTYTEGRK